MTAARRRYERFAAYLGRRGTVLVVFGVIWYLQGVAILRSASPYDPPNGGALLHLAIPDELRALLWIGTGVAAVLAGLLLTPRFQMIGYTALYLGPALRTFSYLAAWAVSLISSGGVEGAWAPGLVWLLVTLVVLIETKTKEQWEPAVARHRKRMSS